MARSFRWQWLAPLMVYFAAGISGFTSIAGVFLCKERFGFDASFMASAAFWASLPWALKIPVGHLADLLWKRRGWLIIGSGGGMASMIWLMGRLAENPQWADAWLGLRGSYMLAAVLTPFFFMAQDAVADAMTVHAARAGLGPRPREEEVAKAHGDMQALGRLVLVSGGLLVGLANWYLFDGADALPKEEQAKLYAEIYRWALWIPLISVAGAALGFLGGESGEPEREAPGADAGILGASALLAGASALAGLSGWAWSKEFVFAVSLVSLGYLARKLSEGMDPSKRMALLYSGIALFAYRAMPGTGAASQWWMIDELHFDGSFLSQLGLAGSVCALAGIWIYKRHFEQASLFRIIAVLTLAGAALSLPTLGMWHGLHHWLEAATGGKLGARFIALADESLYGPLTEIAMIPMLAWIARSAPEGMKAAWFATLASLSNLALSFSGLSTRWLNEAFPVEQSKPGADGAMLPGDYSNFGMLLWTVFLINLAVPLAACWWASKKTAALESGAPGERGACGEQGG